MMEIDFYKGGSVWVIRPPQLSLNYSLSGEFFTYQLVWCFDDIFEVAVYLDSSNEKIYEFVGKIS